MCDKFHSATATVKFFDPRIFMEKDDCLFFMEYKEHVVTVDFFNEDGALQKSVDMTVTEFYEWEKSLRDTMGRVA